MLFVFTAVFQKTKGITQKKSAKLSSRQIEQRSQEPEATMHQWADLYQFIKLPHIAAANAKDKLLRKIDHRR